MIMDRLNDLLDIQVRVIRRLLGLPDPDFRLRDVGQRVILVARDLTPTITVQLDRNAAFSGLATDAGTRTSHSAILARSLEHARAWSAWATCPRVVNDRDELILDGREGRVIVRPDRSRKADLSRARHARCASGSRSWFCSRTSTPVTPDHQPVLLRANIDLPG